MAEDDEPKSEAMVAANDKGDDTESEQEDVGRWDVLVGGAAGFVLGLLTSGVVRTAGAVVGGGLLLLQLARVSGYAQEDVDWGRLQGYVISAANRRRLPPFLEPRDTQRMAQVWRDVLTSLPTSFVGGFLLGFGLR